MNPDLQAVIRELERQRAELLSGMVIAAAYEKAASRACEAIFAAEQSKAKITTLETKVAELTPKPEPKARKAKA